MRRSGIRRPGGLDLAQAQKSQARPHRYARFRGSSPATSTRLALAQGARRPRRADRAAAKPQGRIHRQQRLQRAAPAVSGLQSLEGPLRLARKRRHAESAQRRQMADGLELRRQILGEHADVGAFRAAHIEGQIGRLPIEQRMS